MRKLFKILGLLLALVLSFSLTACSNNAGAYSGYTTVYASASATIN